MIFRYRFAGKISKNNLIRQKNLPATQFLQADHYFFCSSRATDICNLGFNVVTLLSPNPPMSERHGGTFG